MRKFTCPACGFITFAEPSGSFEICAVCGWEDDPVQLKYPGLRIGANGGLSLKEWQDNLLKKHPVTIKKYNNYLRDLSWRPLKEDEVVIGNISSGQLYAEEFGKGNGKYYWED